MSYNQMIRMQLSGAPKVSFREFGLGPVVDYLDAHGT